MKNSLRKLNKWDGIILLLFIVSFVFSAVTVSDTVRATGTGYFMYLNTGLFGRGLWDVLCTAFIVIMVIMLIFAAAKIMNGGITDAAFFFIANGALTEYVRPDKLIAPFTGGDVLDRYGVFFRIVDYLPLWITALVFMILFGMGSEDATAENKNVLKASAVSGAFIILSIIVNSAFEMFLFAAGYVLLFPLIALGSKKEKSGLIPAASVLFVCMIWRLYSVMALY